MHIFTFLTLSSATTSAFSPKDNTGVYLSPNFLKKKEAFKATPQLADKLQIITDFDRTLTTPNSLECHDTFAYSPLCDEDIRNELLPFFNKSFIASIQKNEADMGGWWVQYHKILVKYGLRKSALREIIQSVTLRLREYCDSFFSVCAKKKVPILVVSAGISDVIKECFSVESISCDTVTISANDMKFAGDVLEDFVGDIKHSRNKHLTAKLNSTYFSENQNRNYAIVMGDKVTDLDVLNGTGLEENVIKIGFLNPSQRNNVKDYLDVYDVVIAESSMKFTSELILELLE